MPTICSTPRRVCRLYIYDVESLRQGNVQPKREFPQSTDRIVDIRYKN